jgi:hypothetical protein
MVLYITTAFTGWRSSPYLKSFGKLHSIFTKGEEKVDANSVFGEMTLKKFSSGKLPLNKTTLL